jgi:hypothetical protein
MGSVTARTTAVFVAGPGTMAGLVGASLHAAASRLHVAAQISWVLLRNTAFVGCLIGIDLSERCACRRNAIQHTGM